jgi:ABC-type transporter MlaC component
MTTSGPPSPTAVAIARRVAGVLLAFGVMAAASGVLPGTALADDTPPACDVAPPPAAAANAVHAEMLSTWRSRLAGPAGEAILSRSMAALVANHTDFHVFAERALGKAWLDLGPDARADFAQRLARVVERRYLGRMGSPVGGILDVRGAEGECPEVRLRLAITHQDRRKSKDFEVIVRWDGAAWKAVDAIVDEVSLLHLYRGRFGRVYREGGSEAVAAHLAELERRFGADARDR